MTRIKTSIFVTTYNWPEALEVCLLSILRQTALPNEIIIADDGSGKNTKDVIDKYKLITKIPIHHIWVEDNGYRINLIRNLAIKAAKYPFIIQIDGDIILDKNFIKDHLKLAKSNSLNMGRRVRINEEKAKEICRSKNINELYYFRSYVICWLHHHLFYSSKTVRGLRGCNMAYWKSDALKVNGYDESIIGKGKNDKEFGARLINSGVRGFNLRNFAICYHLDHGDRNKLTYGPENNDIYQQSIKTKKTIIDNGIDKLSTNTNVSSNNKE